MEPNDKEFSVCVPSRGFRPPELPNWANFLGSILVSNTTFVGCRRIWLFVFTTIWPPAEYWPTRGLMRCYSRNMFGWPNMQILGVGQHTVMSCPLDYQPWAKWMDAFDPHVRTHMWYTRSWQLTADGWRQVTAVSWQLICTPLPLYPALQTWRPWY
jgi:hypothetical protein